MFALLTLLACSKAGDSAAPEPPHRDLVLLTLDTLRRDHVGRYSPGGDTPFLDGFAADSLSLDAHHACSNWTYGAFICAFAGADGVDAGFVPTGGDPPPAIPSDMQLLPGLLGDAGFRAGLVSTNGYVGSTSKMNRFYDLTVEEGFAPAGAVVDYGLEMMGQLRGADRWLLHLHFFDPHSPYDAPAEYLGELDALEAIDYDLADLNGVQRLALEWPGLDPETQALVLEHLDVRYRASIRSLDDELARLYGELEAARDLDDALVVVLSDHGEQFFEYGELEHGKSLHGVEVDTFAFFRGPAVEPAAWTERTTHADLAPTTLSLLGLPPDSLVGGGLPGSGAVVGAADPARPLFAAKLEDSETQQSVDLGGKRLIYTWDGQRRLYDLAADPEEQVDLWGSDPDGEGMWEVLLPRVEAMGEMTDEAEPVVP